MNKKLIAIRSVVENNKKQVIVIIIAFLFLLILLLFTPGDQSKKPADDNTKAVYALENELEKKLELFLENVNGVGKVKVCVTFDILEQTEYAKNTQYDGRETSKKTTEEYVIIENNERSESGLPVTVRAPEIRGVAIVCEGGSSAKVKSDVTALICSLLGISSNRVFVAQADISK